MEQNNTDQKKPLTLLEVTGNKISLEQLANAVDNGRAAYEELAKERRNTNYFNGFDWYRPIN